MSSALPIESRFRNSYLFWLLFLLTAKAIISLILIAFYDVNLAPDEAQYWTWSQELDWGYYSKPPGIAWQIWITTALLGNTEMGVRFGAVLIAFFLPLVAYAMARYALALQKTAFWAAIVMAFSPIGIFISFMATTDGGMMLFLLLGICTVVHGLVEEEGPNYPMAGVWILFGALYKWTAFILWPVTLLFLPFFPRLRKWSFLIGIALSLLALVPSLYWNWTHDFATFKHVGATITKKIGHHGNFLDFFFSQIALFSPIYWGLLVCSFFFMRAKPLIFAAAFPLLIFGYLFAAFFKQMQPNWAFYLYPPATLLVAWFAIERMKRGRFWLHCGTYLSLLFSFFAISIPFVQTHNIAKIPYKASPFRQNMGWKGLGGILLKSGYNPDVDFLFGDKYQTASILSFYGPEQKRAYFFNLHDDRKNQFSYWPTTLAKGARGFFVAIDNRAVTVYDWYKEHYEEKLAAYFGNVEFLGAEPLFFCCGEAVKQAFIFRCDDFLGEIPSGIEKY